MPMEWEQLATELDTYMPHQPWAQTLVGIGVLILTALFVQWVVARVVLLLGETASKLVHEQDKSIAMMYGDAGAAVLLRRDPAAQTDTMLCTDGGRFKAIILPGGGFHS